MDDIVYRRAKARVEARLGFYRHAMIYLAVNLFLIFLNLRHERDHFWFQWPLMIQREMERDERARGTRADA